MAYSQDYRQMILAKLESGISYRKLASEYKISKTTVQNWKNNQSIKWLKHQLNGKILCIGTSKSPPN